MMRPLSQTIERTLLDRIREIIHESHSAMGSACDLRDATGDQRADELAGLVHDLTMSLRDLEMLASRASVVTRDQVPFCPRCEYIARTGRKP